MSVDSVIQTAIRADVRAAGNYVVPDSSGFIKLDTMENPYQLPQALRSELGQRLAAAMLNRYPAPSYTGIKQRICAKLGVPAGYDVVLGNGSDELISMLAMACAHQDHRALMLAPVPTFVMYARAAQFAGMDFAGVPLAADLGLDLPAMLAAIAERQPSLVFLSYPNNPTANLFDPAAIEAILRALDGKGIVVVDEAYEPFAQTSFMGRLPEFPNLVVMRTVSKLGLAGIRLGYLSAAPALLAEIEKVRPPYNINILTQIAGEFALDHLEVLNAQAALINGERASLSERLAALPGVTVYPSAANFLLVRLPNADGAHAKLHADKVLVKNVSKMHPLLSQCLRVNVSTPEENAAFLASLTEYLSTP